MDYGCAIMHFHKWYLWVIYQKWTKKYNKLKKISATMNNNYVKQIKKYLMPQK
jgi:hypothetical protein